MRRLFFGGARVDPILADLAVTLVRVGLGAAMLLAHGLRKVPVSDEFVAGVAAMGFPLPEVFAWAAALAEVVGAGLLAVGLLTRPAALSLLATMGVAFFVRHAEDPFAAKEKAFLYGAAALLFLALGSGRFALDRLVLPRRDAALPQAR